jgi:hypothetical protein
MTPHDPYDSWKQQRAGVPVPDGFADRVLARIRTQREQRSRGLVLWLKLLVLSRAGRVALFALAGGVCLFRVLQMLALFLVENRCG